MTECLSRYEALLLEIKTLSLKEKKSLLEKTLKLQEEVGELAEAVLIHKKASGSTYKPSNSLSIQKEAVDILLVTLDIFFCLSPDLDLLLDLLTKKSKKWKKHQIK